MNDHEDPKVWILPGFFCLLLAAAALGWWPRMRHPTYIRQVLLTALCAPAAMAGALAVLGPTWRRLRGALSGGPARLFLVGIWAHAVLAWASLAWTSNAGATVDRSMVLTTLAVWGTAWVLAATGLGWGRLAVVHLVAVGLVALVGTFSHVSLMAAGVAPARLSAPIGNANTVAVLMFFPICGALGALISSCRGEERWPWPGVGILAVLLLGGTTFYFAGSRSGMVGLAAGLFVLGELLLLEFLNRKGRSAAWAAPPLGAVVVAGSIALVLLVASESFAAWGKKHFQEMKNSSVGARIYGPWACLGILREHPIGGAGAGTFLSEAPRHIPRERYMGSYGKHFLNVAHNEYAETAAELGGLGLLAFLAVLGGAFWGAAAGSLRGKSGVERGLSLGLAAAVAGIGVSSIADPSFRYWDFTGVFYSAAALAAAAGALRRDGVTEEETRAVGGLLPRRVLVVLGGAAVCAGALAVWSFKDARREMSYQSGYAASREAGRLEFMAERAAKRGKAADAERLLTAAKAARGRACGHYRVAVESHGYFLSRVLSHMAWVSERGNCARHFAGAMERDGVLRETLNLAERLALTMPDCPQVLRVLAKASWKKGEHAGAVEALILAGQDFRNALPGTAAEASACVADVARKLALNRSEIAVLNSLAAGSRGEGAAALAALEGVEADPERDFLPLDYWRAGLLLGAKRADAAVAALERHLQAVPNHAEGYRALARARAEAAGEVGSAGEIDALAKCLRLNVEHEEARIRLLRVLIARKRYDEALGWVLPYLRIARRKAEFALAAAEIHRLKGEPERARRVLEWGLRQTRGDSRIGSALQRLDASGPGGATPDCGQESCGHDHSRD
ncbi:MAG: O-antigen ligase family protein [Planctomycetota bacterium]